MWRKEDKAEGKPQSASQPQSAPISGSQPPSAISGGPATPTTPAVSPAPASLPVSPRAAACITQGIRIKGEITGKEDLFIDGSLEGKLDLGNASVTVGPNGKVKADISAREVIVRGNVDGKIEGTERVQLWNSGRVTGEVRTERLAIEDGALLRGKVEAGKAHSGSVEGRSKAAVAESTGTGKSNSAAANSRSAVI
ncbi:MAG TPA: polymer-forming cytoskeletal protein [Candidatus Acidoferrum sp.]